MHRRFVLLLGLLLGGCASIDAHRLGTGELPNSDIQVAFDDRNWERSVADKFNYECIADACGKGSQLLVSMLPSPVGERGRIVSGEINEAYLDGIADRIAGRGMTKRYVSRTVTPQYAGYDIMMQTRSWAASHNFMLLKAVYNDKAYLTISSRAATEGLAKQNAELFLASVSFYQQVPPATAAVAKTAARR